MRTFNLQYEQRRDHLKRAVEDAFASGDDAVVARTAQELLALEADCRSTSVPARFQNAALDDFPAELLSQVTATLDGLPDVLALFLAEHHARNAEQRFPWVEPGNVFYSLPRLLEGWIAPALTGPPGVGKTHLAWALRRELVRRGIPCTIVNAVELAQALRSSFTDGNEGAARIIDRLVTTTVLIIDDLDKCRPTAFTTEALFNVINGRSENCAPLALTTNCSPGQLLAAMDSFGEFGPAIVDRLRDLKWLKLSGTSRRGQRAAA